MSPLLGLHDPGGPTTGSQQQKRAPKPKAAGSKSKGAQQQKTSGQGQQRSDPPYHYGRPNRFPNLERPDFRFTALRANGSRVRLEHIEAVSWEDANALLTGELTLRDNPLKTPRSPDLDQGERVLCEVNQGRGFRELWQMRVYEPKLAVSDRQRTFKLANDLDLLRQSEDEFRYHTDARHPRGWLGHEVIADVCNQYRVQIGALYTSTLHVTHFHMKRHSPLDVIRNVVLRERRKKGIRLVIRYDRGKLYVLPLRRSPSLLALGPTLMDAAFASRLPVEFGSAATVHGLDLLFTGADPQTRGKRKPQKMHVEVESPATIRRFGYVHRIVYSPDAQSDADLRKEGLAWLAAVARPVKTLDLTHAGMPDLRRGDAIQLALGDAGLRRQVVWVYGVSHSLTPPNYTMVVRVIFDDPYRRRAKKIIDLLKGTAAEALGPHPNPNLGLPKNNKTDVNPLSPPPLFDPTQKNPTATLPGIP